MVTEWPMPHTAHVNLPLSSIAPQHFQKLFQVAAHMGAKII